MTAPAPTPDPAADPDPEPAPDPEAYDAPRAQIARAKGLEGPYITGGDDPDPGPARREERRLSRLLVLMIVAIVASGFVIGTLLALAGPAR